MAIKTKSKAAAKTAKRAAPPARKAPPQRKTAPASRRPPVQADIEDEDQAGAPESTNDDGTLDIRAVLAGCPTDIIVGALLDELAKRVDYVVKSDDDLAEEIADLWINLKTLERTIIDTRRALDDAIVAMYPVDEENEEELEGTTTHELYGFTIKIARKLTRSIDPDKLTELSEEYDIDDEIARLFRFKPELNLAVYREESDEMKEFFAPVITTKPAKPSITIEANGE